LESQLHVCRATPRPQRQGLQRWRGLEGGSLLACFCTANVHGEPSSDKHDASLHARSSRRLEHENERVWDPLRQPYYKVPLRCLSHDSLNHSLGCVAHKVPAQTNTHTHTHTAESTCAHASAMISHFIFPILMLARDLLCSAVLQALCGSVGRASRWARFQVIKHR
jgi:hypothetical protein